MASNPFADPCYSDSDRPDSARSSGIMSQWSDDYHRLPPRPGYEYIAHSVVMEGPSYPPPPSERNRERRPLQAPGYVEVPPPRPSFRRSIRKVVRRMSYRLQSQAPKEKDADKKGPQPMFTGDAFFVPDTDQQLTFANHLAADTGEGQRWAARFNWDENIRYCNTCETCYLVGKAGVRYACLHPHHLSTLNGQRSLAIVCDMTVINSEGQMDSHATYDFGPGSKYNQDILSGPFDTKSEAMAYTVRDCLEYVVDEVMPKRQDQVVRDHTVTDNVLLKEVPWKCRLLIFAGLDGAPSVLKDNAGPQMRELAATMKRVARLGIDLKWFEIGSVDFPKVGEPSS